MNVENQNSEIKKYFDLWEKYYEEGNKEKARECLREASELKKELWEYEKSEMIKLCEKVGITFDDLQKE